jgi:hypothetical protein
MRLEKGFLFLLDDWRRRNNVSDTMDVIDEQNGLMYVIKDFSSPLDTVVEIGGLGDDSPSSGV